LPRLAVGRSARTVVDAKLRVALGAGAATAGAAAVTAAALAGCEAACAATTAPSSSTIVTIPVRLLLVAPDGFDSTTLNCSVASTAVLPTMFTRKATWVTPGAKVKVAVRVW
jgi:hypothetical protein